MRPSPVPGRGRAAAHAGLALALVAAAAAPAAERHFLYVASPGVRNYVEYGGVGVLVFDRDAGYRCLQDGGCRRHGFLVSMKGSSVFSPLGGSRIYIAGASSIG